MAQFIKDFVQDLNQDVRIRHCGTLVFNGDNKSNVITVSLFNGQEPAQLSGSAVCYVVRDDGKTVPAINGSLSGNTVTVTLTEGCFTRPGPIGVGVQVVSGDVKTTVLKAVYNVETLYTDDVIDPSGEITLSVGELVQRIDNAVASIPADYTDLMAAIAPIFSTSVSYPVGAYAWYDGNLYKFTTAHSGTWNAAHVTQTVLSTDLLARLADYQAANDQTNSTTRKMIAPIEPSATASAAHATGTYFILADTLYTATADIAIGDTITVGTNCAAVPAGISNKLGREVADLKSAFHANSAYDYPLIVAKWTTGKYLTKTGALAGSYDRQRHTEDYYPVTPGQQFYTTCVATGSAAVAVYYDANKNVITGVNRSSSDSNVLTVPNNDRIVYVRFSSEHEGYTYSIPFTEGLDDSNQIAKQVLSQFPIAAVWESGYYINTSGTTTLSANSRYTPDYYPVYPGEVLDVYACGTGGGVSVAYYDQYKQKVIAVQSLINGQITVLDVPIIRYARFSADNTVPVGKEHAYNYVTNPNELYAKTDFIQSEIIGIPFEYAVQWTPGGFVNKTGGISEDASYEYSNYIRVFEGQQLDVCMYAPGTSDVAVNFFAENNAVIQNTWINLVGEKTIAVPEGAVAARFSNQLSSGIRYVRNHGNDKTEIPVNYFVRDADTANYDQTLRQFVPKTERIEHKYTGEVTPQKRFVAFGFDDLRSSDIDMIMPLFVKYGGKALFNRVVKASYKQVRDEKGIKQIIGGKHELGDHTFLHYSFPYFNPLWNGQDPTAVDGNQTPCPTNADFREEYADGKNKFGYALTATVNISEAGVSGVTWANLTDEQCQKIRNTYSVMKNSSLIALLDTLSNRYLGTSGTSVGSWRNGEYTGGIYTGMKTSENHEVWERILTVTQIALKNLYGVNYEMQTWSRPGSYVFKQFTNSDNAEFYDDSFSLVTSPQTKIESSYYKTETGAAKTRSWTDVLREFGYRITHDYPGAQRYLYIGKQFYMNEQGKKRDCVPYPSDYNISFSTLRTEYPESFFTTGKTKAAQMYDASGSFRNFIEYMRVSGASGHIPSEMIDSYDTYSFRVFFESVLRFCQREGFELITKAQAYDICFNHSITTGNLLYNPELKNSAADFFTDATNVPTNPDGYIGTCSVRQDDVPVLIVTGETIYTHYGIPCGNLQYKCKAKGSGTIKVYVFRNNDQPSGALNTFDLVSTVSVSSENEFGESVSNFTILDAPMEEYDRIYEGYAQKIVGIKIVFSAGLEIKNQNLQIT